MYPNMQRLVILLWCVNYWIYLWFDEVLIELHLYEFKPYIFKFQHVVKMSPCVQKLESVIFFVM